MGSNLQPKFVAEQPTFPKLFEKLFEHAYDDRIDAYPLSFCPFPQFDASVIPDVQQHRVCKTQASFSRLNNRHTARVHVRHRKQKDA